MVNARITEDLEEQSLVRDTMLAHYITVVEIFKHYASVGSSVTTGELDLMEVSARVLRRVEVISCTGAALESFS